MPTDDTTGPGGPTVPPGLAVVRGNGDRSGDPAVSKLARVVERINDEYALVVVGNSFVVMQDLPAGNDIGPFRFLSLETFKEMFRPQRIKIGGEYTSYAHAWLGHKERRAYQGIVFAPNREVPSYYNLWRGFSVEPDPAPDPGARCGRFLDHVRENVCGGDEKLARWVIGWFAHLVQHPDAKPGTALVLQGGQGTGKTLVGETVGSLLAHHYQLVSDVGRVTGRFNSHLANALLLQLDEATWGGDHAAAGRIKDLVTNEEQLIEYKGREPVRVKNYVRLLVTSNNRWVVPAEFDERRFAVIRVTDRRRQDRAYFRALFEELDQGGREALLAYLLAFDLGSVDVHHVPTTAALHEQQLQSLPPDAAWWRDVLERGVLPGDATGQGLTKCETLHRAYIDHAKSVGVPRRSTEVQMGTYLKRVVPGIRRRRVTLARPDGGTERTYVYELPTLPSCRLAFVEQMGRHAADLLLVAFEDRDADWGPDHQPLT